MTSPARIIDRSCGPSGCEVDWLTSERHQADDDVVRFTRWATERGWGDGLPLVPPTEGRVRAFLARCGRFPDEVVAELPPLRGECTVEKIAINAVMAGTDPVRYVHTAEHGPVSGPAPAPRLLGSTAELPWRTPDLDEHGAAIRAACPER